MRGYGVFAKYYDELTQNISYSERAKFFSELIKREGVKGKNLLDLACGTGSLSFELARLGFDVIGADGSEDMLAVASQKSYLSKKPVLFINQPMERLELISKQDIIICALDSVNHITDTALLTGAFNRVSENLSQDGAFIFDVNSEYKHFNLLSGKTYVYDCENVYCVWQNGVSGKNIIEIELDFFEKTKNVYRRSSEQFSERFYTYNELNAMLGSAGLEITAVFGDDSFCPPDDKTQRLIYVAKKSARRAYDKRKQEGTVK